MKKPKGDRKNQWKFEEEDESLKDMKHCVKYDEKWLCT